MDKFSYIDAHVHSAFSDDADCPMDAYFALLANGTARAIGFAEHWHPGIEAYRRQYPGYERLPLDNDAYRAKIEQGRARGFTLYRGVELTYEVQWHDACMRGLAAQQYDYVIGSAHTAGGLWVTCDYWKYMETGPAFSWMMEQYYRAVRQCLLVDAFDAIAHIGIYRRDFRPDHFLLQYAGAQIQDLEDEIALAAARSGKIIEVNTSGLAKPAAGCLPGPFFLQRFRHYGGQKLCLSSDAHTADALNLRFDDAAALLVSLGFTELYYPGAPEVPVPLAL